MAEKPSKPTSDPSIAEAPAAPTEPAPMADAVAPAGRRTVTLPVLPLAIAGSVLVALIFFGGGVAVGFAIGHHSDRVGVIQPFSGSTGPFGGQNGGQNGFGPNGGRDGGFDGGFNGQPGGQDGGQPGGQDGRQGPAPAPTPSNG